MKNKGVDNQHGINRDKLRRRSDSFGSPGRYGFRQLQVSEKVGNDR